MFHTENRAQVQGQSQGTRAGLSLTCNRRPCLLPLLFPIVQLLFLRFMPLFCAASVLGYQLLQLFLHPVSFYVSSVQSLCHIQLFATPRTAARQPSLSITNSQSLLKLMTIESVKPSNHLILCRPLLLLPSIFLKSGSFPRSPFFAPGGQDTGVSASASVLPMNIQD